MPWSSNGDYYNFDEAEIKNRAPAATGVYGLCNRRHHILISHTNNIRESLLRHRRETRFRFRRLEPTGFIFEPCSPGMRETLAYQLIREYRPVLRIGESAGMRALWRSLAAPRAPSHDAMEPALAADVERRKIKPDAGGEEDDREILRRDRAAFAGTGFALAIVAVALFVLLGENRSLSEGWTQRILSLGQRLTAFADRALSAAAPDAPGGSQAAAAVSPDPPAAASAAPRQSASGAETGAEAQRSKSILPADAASARRSNLPWTVQVLSTPDLKDATAWHERLKTKGYDAFIVETEIKGKRWYRLRVGGLATVQKAEALVQTLRTREGFDDAFVAPNTGVDVVMASSNR